MSAKSVPQTEHLPISPTLAELAREVVARKASLSRGAEPDPVKAVANLLEQYHHDPDKVSDDLLWLFEESVAEFTRPHLPDFASAMGSQPGTAKFGELVTMAVCNCLLQFPTKRASTIRNELLQVAKAAGAASTDIEKLHASLSTLPPSPAILFEQILGKDWKPFFGVETLPARAATFDLLASFARRSANRLRDLDKGGRSKMAGFRVLVVGLDRAFREVTGRDGKVTWNAVDGAYGGDFFRLVEAVLPVAQEIARQRGKPLEFPAALGDYLKRMSGARAAKGSVGTRKKSAM